VLAVVAPELDVARDVVAVDGAFVVAGRCVVAGRVVVVALMVPVVAGTPPVVDDEAAPASAVLDVSEELELRAVVDVVDAVVVDADFDEPWPQAAAMSATARPEMSSRREVTIESLAAVAPELAAVGSGFRSALQRERMWWCTSLGGCLEGWQSGRMHPP
jgi:hypothetical protein